jgi:hypothetical protein
MEYEEIVLRYVDGGLRKGLDFILEKLDSDIEVLDESSRKKCALRKFLYDIKHQFDEFCEDPDSDPRDNQDDSALFGDDDIKVGPGGTCTDFLEPPDGNEPEFPDEEDYDKGEDEHI